VQGVRRTSSHHATVLAQTANEHSRWIGITRQLDHPYRRPLRRKWTLARTRKGAWIGCRHVSGLDMPDVLAGPCGNRRSDPVHLGVPERTGGSPVRTPQIRLTCSTGYCGAGVVPMRWLRFRLMAIALRPQSRTDDVPADPDHRSLQPLPVERERPRCWSERLGVMLHQPGYFRHCRRYATDAEPGPPNGCDEPEIGEIVTIA
jgi:hypothetical protein